MGGQTNYTDSELISLISDNDTNAFTELYYRYKDKLYAFAFHLSGSSAEAEDLVHEIFSKIWENRGSFKGKEVFGSYLYKMAKNFYIDRLRRFSRETLLRNQLKEDAGLVSTEGNLLYKEMEKILRSSIERLPYRQKEIYILHRDKGLKYNEIAETLGLSISTVENHFSRAMENIRKNFDTEYNMLFLLPLILLTAGH